MCTCLRLSAENGAVVVGRTMEFGAPLESMIAALPRGYDGSSSALSGVGKQWQGRDGVVGASVFGSATTLADGMNEAGVYGGLLYMPASVTTRWPAARTPQPCSRLQGAPMFAPDNAEVDHSKPDVAGPNRADTPAHLGSRTGAGFR